jgi:hypothetical protein
VRELRTLLGELVPAHESTVVVEASLEEWDDPAEGA